MLIAGLGRQGWRALPFPPLPCRESETILDCRGNCMDRLLKIAEVQELTGLGRSTVYKKVAAGVLPAPVRLSRRCARWRASELQAAIEALPRSSEPV